MGIKPKYGECIDCDDGKQVLLYRTGRKECQYHFRLNNSKRYAEKRKLKPKKKQKSIPNFSKKKLTDLAKYRPLRDEYLDNHKYCEVKDCGKNSTNLHHKAGRDNELLYDVRYFMACCSTCHPKRIHENPKWAREKGYIVTI